MKRIATIALALCLLGFTAIAQDPPPEPPPLPEDSVVTTITVTFTDPNTAEQRAASWALARANEGRVAHGYDAYANMGEFCAAIIKRNVVNWISQEAEARQNEEDIRTLWRDATTVQRAAAIAALQAE